MLHSRWRHCTSGFTLIEVMICLGIIVLLTVVILNRVGFHATDDARAHAAAEIAVHLAEAAQLYVRTHGMQSYYGADGAAGGAALAQDVTLELLQNPPLPDKPYVSSAGFQGGAVYVWPFVDEYYSRIPSGSRTDSVWQWNSQGLAMWCNKPPHNKTSYGIDYCLRRYGQKSGYGNTYGAMVSVEVAIPNACQAGSKPVEGINTGLGNYTPTMLVVVVKGGFTGEQYPQLLRALRTRASGVCVDPAVGTLTVLFQ